MTRRGYLIAFAAICAAPFIPQAIGDTTYFTSFAANFVFKNNLHTVVRGRFYRSAEMSHADLARTIREKGIRTVVDLRLGSEKPDEAGQTEALVTQKSGATYFHVPFSSARADQKDKIKRLLEIYSEALRPMLVHCTSGTHRSGIASAIWLLDQEGATPETAAQQISPRYGFFRFERMIKAAIQGEPTLDQVLRRYFAAQSSQDAAVGKVSKTFREWIEEQPDGIVPP